MAAPNKLQGIELIDCAKANASQGIETAAQLCGYGNDLNSFQNTLKMACQDIGVQIKELSDLITPELSIMAKDGIEIAPDTPSQL